MSLLALGTWISVAVLVVGSLGIFAWFLVDVVRRFRRRRRDASRPGR